jgi:hypothetical protein
MDERVRLACMVAHQDCRTFRLGHGVEGRTCGPAPASCLPLLNLTAQVGCLADPRRSCHRYQRGCCRFWGLIKRQRQKVLGKRG